MRKMKSICPTASPCQSKSTCRVLAWHELRHRLTTEEVAVQCTPRMSRWSPWTPRTTHFNRLTPSIPSWLIHLLGLALTAGMRRAHELRIPRRAGSLSRTITVLASRFQTCPLKAIPAGRLRQEWRRLIQTTTSLLLLSSFRPKLSTMTSSKRSFWRYSNRFVYLRKSSARSSHWRLSRRTWTSLTRSL